MSTSYSSKPDGDRLAPQTSVALLAGEGPVMLDCVLWPLERSEFHWGVQVPLATVLSDFIDDHIIPDGTATAAQRRTALKGLIRVRKELDRAITNLKAVPLRPKSPKTRK